ncbi:MAG: hypothetical protein JO069_04565 [Verrucomicrobia bacterium]|nr:hypothetical protein [Verrucomicrobiota bacterium]
MWREWSRYQPPSAAEQRTRAEKAARKLEKQGQPLHPIHIEGREIARTFWGKAWCVNLESYSDYSSRLPRGRSYVRNGAVVDLQIEPGVVKALVSGTRLYRVKITIAPVNPTAWKALKKECAGRVGSLIDLLQGKLSAPVMEVITRRGSGLFPKPSEIDLDCSCPDWAEMCKHVAASLYGVGARLDQSPELLFALRGVDQLELINEAAESVTVSATAGADDAATVATEDVADVFGIELESPLAVPAGPAPVSQVADVGVSVEPVAPASASPPAPAAVRAPVVVVRYRDLARRREASGGRNTEAKAQVKAKAKAKTKTKAEAETKAEPSKTRVRAKGVIASQPGKRAPSPKTKTARDSR